MARRVCESVRYVVIILTVVVLFFVVRGEAVRDQLLTANVGGVLSVPDGLRSKKVCDELFVAIASGEVIEDVGCILGVGDVI